jgi:hypothetical protein
MGDTRTNDPVIYLTRELQAQITPSFPLNLLMGVQNMYTGFEVLEAEGPDTNGAVTVRANLTYGTPKQWTFTLTQQDGEWHIARITPPDTSAPAPVPAPTTSPTNAQGVVYYVGEDKTSIHRINANGTDERVVHPELGAQIDYLGPSPDGQSLVVGFGYHYALLSGGVRVELGDFAHPPHWSSEGQRIAGQSVLADGVRGPAVVYDVVARTTVTLPLIGQPDWYPDGQALVVAAQNNGSSALGYNVYRYDLASNQQTQLTQLVSTESDVWYVQEAHVLPGAQEIVFYGNHTSEVGASGNGQQWWYIPAGGGEQHLYSENYGNGVTEYEISPSGSMVAYSSRAHLSACATVGDLVLRPVNAAAGPQARVRPPTNALDGSNTDETYTLVEGFGWSPDGSSLSFSMQDYTCDFATQSHVKEAPMIYLWDVQSGDMHALVKGSHPVWLAEALPMPGPN